MSEVEQLADTRVTAFFQELIDNLFKSRTFEAVLHESDCATFKGFIYKSIPPQCCCRLCWPALGAIWVDNVEKPTVGVAQTPEGYYLTGAVAQPQCYPTLYYAVRGQ